MGIHDGHRERLRGSFLEHGLQSMNDINALELLLFYALPRRDTNEIAHLLLKRFGSLEGVFDASREELCEVDGIGDYAAGLILLVPEIWKKSRLSGADRAKPIQSTRAAAEYLMPYYLNERDEVIYLMCLDNKRAVICCEEMGRGVVNASDASIRRMVEKALRVKASTVVLSHNHPRGVARPSREDEVFTRALYNAMETVGIRLEDHIIISEGEYFSFADMGILGMF